MKEKTIKGVLLDVNSEAVEVIEIEKELEAYYEILNCRTIDIISRKIGDRYFDIVCDDEGLFVEDPKISALGKQFEPQLVGNLFIVQYNGKDDITSLTDEEIEYVKSKIKSVSTGHFPKGYPMLTELGV